MILMKTVNTFRVPCVCVDCRVSLAGHQTLALGWCSARLYIFVEFYYDDLKQEIVVCASEIFYL